MAERPSTFLKNAWAFKQAKPTYVNKTKGPVWVVSTGVSQNPCFNYALTQPLHQVCTMINQVTPDNYPTPVPDNGNTLMFPVTPRTLTWMARNPGDTPNWWKRSLPYCPSNKNRKGTNLLNDYWDIFYPMLFKNAILTFKFLRKLIRINHKNYRKKSISRTL